MIKPGDRFVDLSLRILSGALAAVLLVALAILLWRFFAPAAPRIADVPLVEAPKPAPPVEAAAPPPAAKAEVLMNPGRIYRCVVNGRTTFSDRPCPDGAPR